MSVPLLDIVSLSVRIGGHKLLDRVSLQLDLGETLALTGESGSGKSLTALAVMGLLPDSVQAQGRIALAGQPLHDLPERTLCQIRGRDIGMVFQEPMTALNPVQRIGDQIAETLLLKRDDTPPMTPAKAAERTRELLSRVGMAEIPPDRFPHELSGGQRQRVVIAMAIANRPRLLIADEPTTALDVTTQAQILSLLTRLTREEGMALLMITHDLAVVADMADRIAVMQQGRIVETGATDRILSAPQDPYTRDLLAASAHRAQLPDRPLGAPFLHLEKIGVRHRLPRPHPFAPAQYFDAVRDISLTLHRGERVGLVGESGCGKSTLARVILGLLPPATGRVMLDGVPLPRHGQRRIQAVFQDPYSSFNPRHRVSRLLAEPYHLTRHPPLGAARRGALERALQEVDLPPDALHRHIHAFSGGQRQRLAIARALLIQPEMIVFDEAVSALDVRVRARILDLLARISDDHGLGYLFITHDLSVVRSVTTRILVMRAGQIVEDGPTEQVFAQPRHSYTAELLAAAPVLPEIASARA